MGPISESKEVLEVFQSLDAAHHNVMAAHPEWSPTHDARAGVFGKLKNAHQSVVLGVVMNDHGLGRDVGWLNPPPNDRDLELKRREFDVFLRLGYLAALQACIESSLRQIGAELGVESTQFSKLTRKLFVAANCEASLAPIELLRLIRNGMHNNGRHSQDHEMILWEGTLYDFRRGQLIEAPFAYLFPIVMGCARSLETLVLTPLVAAPAHIADF